MKRERLGSVVNIFTCPDQGMPMEQRSQVQAKEGQGLDGDRYALGTGLYSGKRAVVRHVSLIGIEAIEAANEWAGTDFTPAETRRNIVTEGVDLNALLGIRFAIGEVMMEGVELCTPCKRPSQLTTKPGFKDAFENRGGLRAEILNSGLIVVGHEIVLSNTQG